MPPAGESLDAGIVLETAVRLRGWSFALEHPARSLEVVDVSFGEVLDQFPNGRKVIDTHPAVGSGWSQVVRTDDASGTAMLQPGTHVVARARYRVIAQCPSVLRFADNEIGSPPIRIVLTDAYGMSMPPQRLVDGALKAPASPTCAEECWDRIDNDGDTLVDCGDPDCAGIGKAEVCEDGLDNDCDELVDCADQECVGVGREVCGDGLDNNCDGATDCADPSCEGKVSEVCGDGIDNDCDGALDCGDQDCLVRFKRPVRCHASDLAKHCVEEIIRCSVAPGGGAGAGCISFEQGWTRLDAWKTVEHPGVETCQPFGIGDVSAIPENFFEPGSEPFFGKICFRGVPVGDALGCQWLEEDTLIWREKDPFDDCDMWSDEARTVQIEIAALSLESKEPILVDVGGVTALWDVAVSLSDMSQEQGTLTAWKTECNGGTWNAEFRVWVKLTFTKVGDPGMIRILDPAQLGDPEKFGLAPLFFTTAGNPWVSRLPPGLLSEDRVPTGFHPGVGDLSALVKCVDCNGNGRRDDCDLQSNLSKDMNANGVPDECEVPFHRGDPNDDGLTDLSDAIRIFQFLFLGAAAPPCMEAANANNDDDIDISDGIAVLIFLFFPGSPGLAPPGPPPGPCGVDRPELYLGCRSYTHCP